jgi:hypothetical protein
MSSQTTNKEIAVAITDRLLDRHIVKRHYQKLRSRVEREIEWVLMTKRIDPWPEDEKGDE